MQMKMMKNTKKFDRNKVKKLLEDENKYIVDLLTTFDVPDSVDDTEMDEMYLLNSNNNNKSKSSIGGPTINDFKKTQRAQTSDELEERLNIIKNKMKAKKNKVSERKTKKREMKKLKKNKEVKKILISAHKSMKNEKQKGFKPDNHDDDSLEDKKDIKPLQAKPIFNEEGKIVFSKFDFASHPGGRAKKGRKDKVVKNPKEILRIIKENTKKITELKELGDEDKAKELKDNLAWQKVFDKVDGKSVRDDPSLLLKSIKKKKDIKKKSKKKWQEREKKVEADIASRQKKRQDNIDKRLKDKKKTKLKRLSKKGRIIPGFS